MKQNNIKNTILIGTLLFHSSIPIFTEFSCQSTLAKEIKEIVEKDGKNSDTKTSKQSNWKEKSKLGAKLIAQRKYSQANELLASILPQARKEAPDSLDLGICLARYGIGLYAEKKYAKSLPVLEEALKIVQKKPITKRQEEATYQILGATAAAHLKLKHFDKAEQTARKAIAYGTAFPNIASSQDVKKSYAILRMALENQKKTDEAAQVTEVFNSL